MRDSNLTTEAIGALSDRVAYQQNRIYDVAALLTGLEATIDDGPAAGPGANYHRRIARQAIAALEVIANQLSLIDDDLSSGKEGSHE